jgi:amino acid transporter
MPDRIESGLLRGIRRWDLAAVAINGIIGAGIFGLPAQAYKLAGVYSILAFVVCAAIVTLIILCFAEVASRFSGTGGPYLYAQTAFGPFIGFEVGWMMWLARVTAFAANCNLFVGYLSYFWSDADTPAVRAGVIGAVVLLITAINILGVRDTAVITNWFTIAKLVPLTLFICAGLFFVVPANYAAPATLPTYGQFSAAVLLLVYAFTGFEMAVIPAGEVENPKRNIPVAVLTAIGVVAVFYVLIQVVCIGTLPDLAGSSRPLADASRTFAGSAGATVISAGAMISIIANLNVIILAGSRLPFAMAAGGDLPGFLSRTNRRFRTPHSAILLTALVVLVMTLSWSFVQSVAISTVARLLAYVGTCASLPVLRRKTQEGEAGFRVPAGSLAALAALVLSAWLLSHASGRELRDAAIAGGAGIIVYFGHRILRRRRAGESGAQVSAG